MLDRDSIIDVIKSKDENYSLSLVNELLSELSNLEVITFSWNNIHVIFVLTRLSQSFMDYDIEDLLQLDSYSVSVKAFIDKEINGKKCEFRASLINDVTTINRLKGIVESIDTINISRIDDVISKDSRNNKWNIQVYNVNGN